MKINCNHKEVYVVWPWLQLCNLVVAFYVRLVSL